VLELHNKLLNEGVNNGSVGNVQYRLRKTMGILTSRSCSLTEVRTAYIPTRYPQDILVLNYFG